MIYYNVHTHILTMGNIPKRFLNQYLPGPLADALDKLTNTKLGAYIFGIILSLYGGSWGKQYASFLKIGKSKSQMDVFENLMEQYDEDICFIALTENLEFLGGGSSPSGFEGQIEEILEVKRRYPERLLVFLGIDPRWKENGPELRDTIVRYFETKISLNNGKEIYPFAGLNIRPSTGFFPFDIRLKESFEWASENKVPIMSHCYFMGGIFNNDESYLRTALNPINPYTNEPSPFRKYFFKRDYLKWFLGHNNSFINRMNCSYFIEPEAYRDLLGYFQKGKKNPLKICLAHFGGAEQILISHGYEKGRKLDNPPFGILPENWYQQIKDLLSGGIKGLFTDISFSLFETAIFPYLKDNLNNPDFGDKILFGDDYYLTEPSWKKKSTYKNFREVFSAKNNAESKTLWEKIASENPKNFLKSKYYLPE